MHPIFRIAAIAFLSYSPTISAQTTLPENSSVDANCQIALPYKAEMKAGCTPQSAAAYDFAFCSAYFIMGSLAAPVSDKSLGENSKSAAIKRKGIIYANLSEKLSNNEILKKNIDSFKEVFDSVKESEHFKIFLEYVALKCGNIESHHAAVIDELVKKMKGQPEDGH